MTFERHLSDAEQHVWDAFRSGHSAEFGTKADDPAKGMAWGVNRRVGADVLVALLSGEAELDLGRAGVVDVRGASVIGKISVPGGRFDHQLRLMRCYIADGIELSGVTTRSVRVNRCYSGPIRMKGAKIDGVLDLSDSYLVGRHRGPALNADGLIVTQDMFCDGKFRAKGEVRLLGANIGARIRFSGAHLDGRGGFALNADGLTVAQDIFCDGNFSAKGAVCLIGASVGGQLNFNSARLDGDGGVSLYADIITVAQGILFDGKFRSDGPISLQDATLKGTLTFSGAHLNGRGGPALNAIGLTVTQDIFCDGKFRAIGTVLMAGASVRGQLSFSGAHLDGDNGPALTADVLSVAQAMFCDEGFRTKGEVSLWGATIGSQLSFSEAHLDGREGVALVADRLTVNQDLVFDEKFQASDEIRLPDAKIGTLRDDKQSWPKHLELDGLTYGNMTYLSARDRLDWLNRSTEYRAQPYEHLAAYYQQLGHDEEARRVLLAKQRKRTNQRQWWQRGWGWWQDGVAGYGYAPGRAVMLLTGAFVAGWLVFRSHHPAAVGPGPHPAFNAALYTLDVLVPAPSLGDANDWDPHGVFLLLAAGLHVVGWLLAITVIAAVTRSFGRD